MKNGSWGGADQMGSIVGYYWTCVCGAGGTSLTATSSMNAFHSHVCAPGVADVGIQLESLREQVRAHAATLGANLDPFSRSAHLERGQSAVTVAKAREPWRSSVDEWDLLPDANR